MPQTFESVEQFLGGEKPVYDISTGEISWDNIGVKTRPSDTDDKKKIYYSIGIGVFDYKKAVAQLVRKHGLGVGQKVSARQYAYLAVVVVDERGFLVSPDGVGVSSFAWALQYAMGGQFDELLKWSREKGSVEAALSHVLDIGRAGRQRPLSLANFREAYQHLVQTLAIPSDLAVPQFLLRRDEYKPSVIPQAPLLNSFFVNDLLEARFLADKGELGKLLKLYLGLEEPIDRQDIMDFSAPINLLRQSVAPANFPLGRWPAPGGHPLVLMQQAAVNQSFISLEQGGILAVNGPPGTGKTTLLRDVVAGIIAQRAQAMCQFDDPKDAFSKPPASEEQKPEEAPNFAVANELRGFEILIASSNNKAVENISRELPARKAISNDLKDFQYFSCLAEQLIGIAPEAPEDGTSEGDTKGKESDENAAAQAKNKTKTKKETAWGVISAPLGSASNRRLFRERFWSSVDPLKKEGLYHYLLEVLGKPQIAEEYDKETKQCFPTNPPRIVLENDPPQNREEALRRWYAAKANFLEAVAKVQEHEKGLTKIYDFFDMLDRLPPEESNAKLVNEADCRHRQLKPRWFSYFLSPIQTYRWHQRDWALARLQRLHAQAQQYRQTLDGHAFDQTTFQMPREKMHLLSPWFDKAGNRLRDQVFVAAIKVHKAFIDAAAAPIMENLNSFFGSLANRAHTLDEHLWATFFLVVPCVSTTFASVSRMIGRLPEKAFGWLFIDEAGQATPQSPVGALGKARRTIVVGDPLQLQPIVTLPEQLTTAIFRYFKAEPELYNAPHISVQTIADRVAPIYGRIVGRKQDRCIGLPLVVHRRCENPMFDISNKIAYDGYMVHAKKPSQSRIREVLGNSTWFDVRGGGTHKYCAQEGQQVLALLHSLASHKVTPDLYICSPFREVALQLRKAIEQSKILPQFGVQNSQKWLEDTVGTVHILQGKEAEALILVLGMSADHYAKSRQWVVRAPNLLNVAVTRAKSALYIVGNHSIWAPLPYFDQIVAEEIKLVQP